MKLFITAVVVCSLSLQVIASPISPIIKTIVGDSYTAYEATKICANELFYNPYTKSLFTSESASDQTWELTYVSEVQLGDRYTPFKANFKTRIQDDKIHVTIDDAKIIDSLGREVRSFSSPHEVIKPLENKLYDAYESFMICVSDY